MSGEHGGRGGGGGRTHVLMFVEVPIMLIHVLSFGARLLVVMPKGMRVILAQYV